MSDDLKLRAGSLRFIPRRDPRRFGEKGQTIGANDPIIAITARCHDLSLLTDNANEFSGVSDLRVIPFVP